MDTNNIITTFAGTGIQGSSGDGGPATSAQLLWPEGINFDAAGNAYIADNGTNTIRKVNSGGIISTIAGGAGQGYSGNGSIATLAKLTSPAGIASDSIGNVYFCEEGNNTVRKVNNLGILNPIAGDTTGLHTGNSGGFNGDGGTSTSSKLNYPMGITLDQAGNLYIADANNNRIRKITACNLSVTYTLQSDPTPHVWDLYPTFTGGTTPYSYVWNWGDGSPNSTIGYPSHTYSVPAYYNICLTLTDANGCSSLYCENDSVYRTNQNANSSTIIQVNVQSGTMGVKNIAETNRGISIFPNPSNDGNFTVTNSGYYDLIRVTNVYGQEVNAEVKKANGTAKVHIATPGAYSIFINSQGITKTLMVIVNKN